MIQNKQLYSIQQLSTELNIPKPTLRFWEKEFKDILKPLRTDGGQRRYTVHNIAIIKKISYLKKAGLRLAEIKRKLNRSQGERHSGTDGIDLLADKVADIVRMEVIKFLRKGEG